MMHFYFKFWNILEMINGQTVIRYHSGTKSVFNKQKQVINWNWHYNVGIASSHPVLLPLQDSLWTSQESPGYVKNEIVESESLLKLAKPVKNY